MKLSEFTESCSDAEFLSFLYSERKRLRNNNLYPGWSSWALVCVLFALAAYCYGVLKTLNGRFDIVLLYHIFTAFCPVTLFTTHMIEWKIRSKHGNAVRLARLKEVAPVSLLSFILVISILCTVLGFLYPVFVILPYCWIVTMTISGVCLWSVYKDRNQWVTRSGVNFVSCNSKLDNKLIALLLGVLVAPSTTASLQLSFGISIEFEVCICLIVFLVVAYVLQRCLFANVQEKALDDHIYGYLYEGKSKQSVVKQLEISMLGILPSDSLYSKFSRMIEFQSMMPTVKKRLMEVEDELKSRKLTLEEVNELISEFTDLSAKWAKYNLSQTDFIQQAHALIKLETTVYDKDFVTMIETMPDLLKEFEKTTLKIGTIMDALRDSVYQIEREECDSLCVNMDCKKRVRCLKGG